ncbi:hypothetical protein HZA55_00190 [Candidatus Poribacteria bacterium]|nr:hypothetical protein [Candidatus Poribacteria bacterium]
MKIASLLILLILFLIPTKSLARDMNFVGVGGDFRSFSFPIIAFSTDERDVNIDLNDDGDKIDAIVRYFNVETKELVNTKIWGNSVYIDKGTISFTTPEGNTKQDLNNDGDMADLIVQYYDISQKALFNTKLVGFDPVIKNNFIYFRTNSGPYNSLIIRIYNIATGEVIDTGVEGQFSYDSIDNNIISFISNEQNMRIDLNKDGDKIDSVVGYYDVLNKKLNIISYSYFIPSLNEGIVSFITFEGYAGLDLNFDGDRNDFILQYFDINNNLLTNTKLIAYGNVKKQKENICFDVQEYVINKDLDGDGDLEDLVVNCYNIQTRSIINTESAGSLRGFNGNIISLVSNESMMNKDINNDGFISRSTGILGYYDIDSNKSFFYFFFDNIKDRMNVPGQFVDNNNIIFNVIRYEYKQDLNNDGDLNDSIREVWHYLLPSYQDQTPPNSLILSSIDDENINLTDNAFTASNSITFTFSGIDNVAVAGLQCSLDSSVFVDCVSPQMYTNLALGNHVFKVRAKDVAGNIDNTPATFSWTIKPLPVILLPGILGSWTDNFFEPFTNSNSIDQSKLSLTEESQSWFWKQLDNWGYLPHTWQDLKIKLPELGYPIYKCPYDWRNNNEYSAQNYLMSCIDKAKQETSTSKVNVIAHSMGGLTTRAYIQNDSLYRNDINKFVMLGTPNHGSLNAYYPWEGGSLSSLVSPSVGSWTGILGTILENSLTNRLAQIGVHFLRTEKVNYMHSFFPSVQELLPTFDYLKNIFGNIRNTRNMAWQNNFLNDLNSRSNISRLNSQVNTKIFAGEGYPTLETIKVLYPNPDNLFGDPEKIYPDGLPVPLLEEKNVLGDGTVLSQKSAKITEADVSFETKTKNSNNSEIFLEHANLPNAFFGEIMSFLGIQTNTANTVSNYSPIFPKEVLSVSLASPAELLIIDPQGRKLGFDYQSQGEKYEIPKGIYSGKDELELAMIIDPQQGNYQVLIIGNGEGEFNTGISYAKDGCADVVNQDNFGNTRPGHITAFTINLRSDCSENSAAYSLNAIIDIDPETINLSSKGNHITAYIELPDLYQAENIDVSTIKLNNQISTIWFLKTIGDYDNNGIKDLMVKFKRNEVQDIVSLGDNQLLVSGNLRDGTRFEGEDIIKVISNK